jgi:hypothetical protein
MRALQMLLWSGIAALAAVAAFILFYVRPFQMPPRPATEMLATSWNESISHLGISPLYPPQEDLQVGDVLAVIVGGESTPLLRRAIRMAHIDMRDIILKEQQNQLPFADTVMAVDGDPGRSDRLAVAAPADRVALTLVAFPGLTVRYAGTSVAAAGAGRWSLIGSRRDEEAEEIRIPVAETYGVSQASAVQRLQDWCNSENHREGAPSHCSKDFVRRVLQFALGEDIFVTIPGAGKPQADPHVELVLITRVYLMREIDEKRVSASNREAGAAGPDATGRVAALFGSRSAENSANTGDSTDTGGMPAGPAASSSSTVSRTAASTEIALHRSFQRPLVFGYRSVRARPR